MTHPTPYQAQRIEAAIKDTIPYLGQRECFADSTDGLNTFIAFEDLYDAAKSYVDSIPHPEPSAEVVDIGDLQNELVAYFEMIKSGAPEIRDKVLLSAVIGVIEEKFKAAIRAMQQGEK